MHDARPSLAKRALAILVLAIVAVVAFRVVVGVISAVFWVVAVVALIVAGLWAVSTLRSGKRAPREQRSVKPAPRAPVPAAQPQDRVEAEMARIREQLREQGRT